MKYIKTYEKFDLVKENPGIEIGSDMTSFNDSEKWIKDFNTKKGILLGIYNTYKEDEKPVDGLTSVDLYNKLLSGKFITPSNTKSKIIFTNPLFNIYSQYCQKNRMVKNINNSLNQKKQEMLTKQASINNNEGDRETINTDIAAIKADMDAKQKELLNINKDIQSLQKSSSDELTNKAKSIVLSKKRITQFDIKPKA